VTTDLVTLRRLVRQRVGVPASDSFFTDAVLNDTINQAIATLDAESRWPWMEQTDTVPLAAGATYFAVPAAWRATRSLFNGTNEMGLVSPSDIMGAPGAGPPSVWAPVGNRILIAPAANAALNLTHLYYLQTVDLVADTDVTLVPDQFNDAVVCKAAELLSAREDDAGARSAHAQDYGRWVDRMKRDVRRSTGPVRVRVRPGGWV
jgi:hypothetical protein